MTHPINPNSSVPPVSVDVGEQEKPCTCESRTNDWTKPHEIGCPAILPGDKNYEASVKPDAPKASVEAKPDLGLTDAQSDNAEAVLQKSLTSRYVVGFFFDWQMANVALIRKNKPAWQAGKLNGVGGKIELGETPEWAMRREFQEEAGWYTESWRQFCVCAGINNDGSSFELHCFYTKDHDFRNIHGQEAEKIEIISVSTISLRSDTIGNLAWLIELAKDMGGGVSPPRIVKAEYGTSVVNANQPAHPLNLTSDTVL